MRPLPTRIFRPLHASSVSRTAVVRKIRGSVDFINFSYLKFHIFPRATKERITAKTTIDNTVI